MSGSVSCGAAVLAKELLRTSEEGDRISCLPDDVICHILSFLPTKYSVRTRLLSTRWRYLFAFVPVLDFFFDPINVVDDDDDDGGRKSFINFVNRVFVVHNVPQMTRFRLLCYSTFTEQLGINDFVSWISSVICRNVRELDIDMAFDKSVTLPRGLFSSHMLSVLKLDGDFVIKLPSCASLPCLKTLHLHSVLFDDSTGRIFSICPILEDLWLGDCHFENAGVLDVSHPILRKLKIQDCHAFDLVLNVPSLVDFQYSYNTTSVISGEIGLKSLDKVRLLFETYDVGVGVDVVAKLLTLVSHARHLSLCASELCFSSVFKLPSCASLPCLKTLHLRHVLFDDSTGRIFSICPILEDLWLDYCDLENAGVLDISHPILRKLKIEGCHGYDLVLNVPSLVDFEYLYNTTSSFFGGIELKSLDKACLIFNATVDVDVVAKLFTLVSHARHLSLCRFSIEALQGCIGALPTFHKLTILEVGNVTKLVLGLLPDILNRCSLLEVLVFTKGSNSEVDDTCMKCYENVPSCVTMCLKEIKFRRFKMLEIECNLVEYFLKNAQVLEKLNIRSSLCLKRRHLLSRKLLTLYKFSRGCKIEIESDGETED